MYNGNPKLGADLSNDVFNYVEGLDIFNSAFIYYMDKLEIDPLIVNNYPERLDLYSNITTYGMNGVKNRYMDPTEIRIGSYMYRLNNSDIISILNGVSHGR